MSEKQREKCYRIPLPDADDVWIYFPYPMTAVQWDCFIQLLQLFKLGMVDAPTEDGAV